MVVSTIVFDTFRHAWRFRLPAVIAALLLTLISALPRITSGDGSLEGQLRLFLLYAGTITVYGLSLLCVGYSVWFEGQERFHRVHLLMHTRPVARATLLLSRIFAYLLMLFLISCACFGAMSWIALKMGSEAGTEQMEMDAALARMVEVRDHVPLSPIIELDPQEKRLERQQQEVVTLEPGLSYPFTLPLTPQSSDPELSGRLLTLGSSDPVELRIGVLVNGRGAWGNVQTIVPGQEFRVRLPVELSRLEGEKELRLLQLNPDKKALFLPIDKPLRLTHPSGSLGLNVLKAGLMLSLLFLSLLCLGVFTAQLLSPQGSLMVVSLVYLIGSFKGSISNLLFPPSMIPEHLRPDEAVTVSEVFYTVTWRPLLWLVPDFQALNPTVLLTNGHFIGWDTFLSEATSTLPFLTLMAFYLFYFLPRQERAVDP